MNLLQLAPDLQEELLFRTRPERGRDPWHLRLLQPIAAVLNWHEQRRRWRQLPAPCASHRVRARDGHQPLRPRRLPACASRHGPSAEFDPELLASFLGPCLDRFLLMRFDGAPPPSP
jgi:hypothetical protein